MAHNTAVANGGSAYVATPTASLTFENVNVTDSVAGQKGGGVALASSTGEFRRITFGRCNASLHGGALAAWGDEAEMTIEDGAFSQCRVQLS